MTRIAPDWLTAPATQAVFEAISRGGYQAWAVGGAVRNALMGLPAADVDMATDAPPEAVIALGEAAGLRAVPTGIAHGTVTLVSDGIGFELTTLRRDAETFGRHARVEFGAALEEDAARRDFTINALYAAADGTVIDPLGGLPDVAARRIRFIGDPHQRITEDALRILRYFRFFAEYAGPDAAADPEALAAISAHVEMLGAVSAERIGAELRKLLRCPHPLPAYQAMLESGIAARVLPHPELATRPRALARLIALEPETEAQSRPWLRRLALLTTPSAAEALRLTRAETKDLARLTAAAQSDAPAARLGHDLGPALATDALLLRATESDTPLPEDWPQQIARGANARFPLKPVDLQPQLSGPALGAALERGKSHWFASDFSATREDLLQALARDGII